MHTYYAIYEHPAYVCACVRARVFVLACESVRNCMHACNTVSQNEPPSVKAEYEHDLHDFINCITIYIIGVKTAN